MKRERQTLSNVCATWVHFVDVITVALLQSANIKVQTNIFTGIERDMNSP